MLVWVRHRDQKSRSGIVSLLALADALPPASTIVFLGPAPISTMMWAVDIFDPAGSTMEGWWLAHCKAETAREGYSSQHMLIWNSDGRPIIATRLTIAIFSKG